MTRICWLLMWWWLVVRPHTAPVVLSQATASTAALVVGTNMVSQRKLTPLLQKVEVPAAGAELVGQIVGV